VNASLKRDCDENSNNRYTATPHQGFYNGALGWSYGQVDESNLSLLDSTFGFFNLGNLITASGVRAYVAYLRKVRTSGFPSGCKLPLAVTSTIAVVMQQDSFQSWSVSSNTFPGTSTKTDVNGTIYHIYSFENLITISECRLVYPARTVTYMNNVGQVCDGFSYT
jgi:hypothetical protein